MPQAAYYLLETWSCLLLKSFSSKKKKKKDGNKESYNMQSVTKRDNLEVQTIWVDGRPSSILQERI